MPRVLPDTRGPQYLLMRHYSNLPRGRSVIKIGGLYRTLDNPDQDLLDAATEVYLGGHIYTITQTVADALTAAGYGTGIAPDPTGPEWGDYGTMFWGELSGYTWGGLPVPQVPESRGGHYGGYSEAYG